MSNLRVVFVCFVAALTQTKAKEYAESAKTDSENHYGDYEKGYQHVYQLSPSDRNEYQAIAPVTVFIRPVEKPTYVLKSAVESPSSNALVAPTRENLASDVDYYPYAYAFAKSGVTTTGGTYVPVQSKDTNHLSHHSKEEDEEKKKYKYGYRITDPHHGAEFGHSEVNDGVTAKGYYHVLLPDGRLQNVKYWAGESGFNAVITYDN